MGLVLFRFFLQIFGMGVFISEMRRQFDIACKFIISALLSCSFISVYFQSDISNNFIVILFFVDSRHVAKCRQYLVGDVLENILINPQVKTIVSLQ